MQVKIKDEAVSKNPARLNAAEMEQFVAGTEQASGCTGLALACGAGLALSLLTGGIGAIIFGPATAGLCYATAKC